MLLTESVKIWLVDRGLDPGVPGQLPADVDLQAGIRGDGQTAGGQEVSIDVVPQIPLIPFIATKVSSGIPFISVYR